MSEQLTPQDLKAIADETSGVTDGITFDDTTLDTPLRELGYDSLAVLEIVSAIQRKLKVQVPDEAIEEMRTARAILDYVNLTRAAVA